MATLYFTSKNFSSMLTGVCVIGLALIPLFVTPSDLSALIWRVLIVILTLTGLVTIVAQNSLQAKDEEEMQIRQEKRDAQIQASLDYLVEQAKRR